jgi:glycosyltransferase involved in cell wall biosynthesis
MKLGIVLDNKINKWAMQRFEPLKEEFDITVFIGERNDYNVRSIDLDKKFLNHKEEIALALRDPVTAFKRTLKAPFKKMDFYYFSLRKYLKGYDLVYSYDLFRSAYTLASLKEETGYRMALAWWENIPYRAEFDDKSSYCKKFIMQNTDLLLPFTESAKKALLLEGISEDKIKVIYPGVDLQRFKPGKRPSELSDRYNIPENSFVILYVGKLVSWKGVHNLVYAAKLLKEKGLKDFIFAVAGKGAQKENMEKLIAVTGTADNFRFLDFISYDEIPGVYRMADVLVLPSYPTMTWQEQFGMVLVEAMATGVPVISTLSGSIPEVVGNAGILIPPGDYRALTDALIELMEDRSLREGFSQKCRDRAERLFETKKVADDFSRALKKIR